MGDSADEWRSARLEFLQKSAAHCPTRRRGISMPSTPRTMPLRRHTRSGETNHGGGYRPVRLALAFVVAIAAMMLFGVSTTGPASAAPPTGSVTTVVPTDQLPAGVSEAVVTVTDFANQDGDLVATGTATITDAAGNQDTQAFQVSRFCRRTAPARS